MLVATACRARVKETRPRGTWPSYSSVNVARGLCGYPFSPRCVTAGIDAASECAAADTIAGGSVGPTRRRTE